MTEPIFRDPNEIFLAKQEAPPAPTKAAKPDISAMLKAWYRGPATPPAKVKAGKYAALNDAIRRGFGYGK